MATLCPECMGNIKKMGAGIVRGDLKGGVVNEEKGYTICFSHVEPIRNSFHRLEELPEGPIFLVDRRSGVLYDSFVYGERDLLSLTNPIKREEILGYLSEVEAFVHFPRTVYRIKCEREGVKHGLEEIPPFILTVESSFSEALERETGRSAEDVLMEKFGNLKPKSKIVIVRRDRDSK